jgi:hypothetical protein
MITFLEGFKYLAAAVVAISVPGFGLVALTFLMFCDHGPFFVCFLRMALTGGIAIAPAHRYRRPRSIGFRGLCALRFQRGNGAHARRHL